MTTKKCKAVFTTPKKFNPISAIVKLATGEKYTHCAWVTIIDDLPEKPLVYHASKFNVHFVSFKNFLEHNEIVHEFTFDLDREEYLDTLNFCIDNLGQSYDFLGLIFNPFFKLFGIKNKHNICSELLIKILKAKIHYYGEVENIVPEEVKIAIENYKALEE